MMLIIYFSGLLLLEWKVKCLAQAQAEVLAGKTLHAAKSPSPPRLRINPECSMRVERVKYK